jgi:hypothetical protein
LTERQKRRIRATERSLADAAKTHSQPLTRFLQLAPSTPRLASDELQLRFKAIEDLEKLLRSKKNTLKGQNLTRHQAVLALLYMTQSRKVGDTREKLSSQVARTFDKGINYARKIVKWEGIWIRERHIPEGKRGCFAKVFSWFNDEGVQLAVREWCAGAGETK